MKISELENRFREHAKIAKSSIATPIDIESEEFKMQKKNYSMKNKVFRIAAAAATITAITAISAFAMSPTGQEIINSIVEYFQNDKATEITSIEELNRYNKEIGKSVTKDGITLTLDNVAADDNFIHVFYTIRSENEPFYEGDYSDAAIYADDVNMPVDALCLIDGMVANFANNNTKDGYFVDNYTYKTVEKYNISSKEIPDNFKVELFADIIEKDGEYIASSALNKLYNDAYDTITDEEKAEMLYISVNVDKSDVRVETINKEINTYLPWLDATVEKAVFSPFGNQLVISTPPGNIDNPTAVWSGFALYDENGTCLDILNTYLVATVDGSSRNSYEFLKADVNTGQLKFVPLKFEEHGDMPAQEQKIGTYPLVYKTSDYGSVIVTGIRISDGKVEIDYYLDGFTFAYPGFVLLDDSGKNAEPGGKLGCTLYTDVHHDTNSYTARYVYEKYDEAGNPVPPDESVSAESIAKTFTTLGVWEQSYVVLDFDNAVTVNLEHTK